MLQGKRKERERERDVQRQMFMIPNYKLGLTFMKHEIKWKD